MQNLSADLITEENLYVAWLNDFNARVQGSSEIKKVGGIPFVKWFENEVILSCQR